MVEIPILLSYIQDRNGRLVKRLDQTCHDMGVALDLFIDSGAFSAKNSGAVITVKQYADFLLDNIEYIKYYANLDCIGDYCGTQENQEILEDLGLHPVPVFHQNTDFNVLISMIQSYEGKIALGGLRRNPKWMFDLYLQACSETIRKTQTDKVNHFHLFGVTPTKQINEIHEWGSFDSSIGAGFRWNYIISPRGNKINLSKMGGIKRKVIYFKTIIETLQLSERSVDIFNDAKRPTRGFDSGLFWNVMSMLGSMKMVDLCLHDTRSHNAIFYTVLFPLKSPYLELLISGAKDIYESRDITSRID